MRAYNTIMESYTWEGFEEEIYQHFKRCMDHVDMGEIYNSLKELSQPPLSSLGVRGELSMDHSICMRRAYGKEHIYVQDVLLHDYLHSFTMYMQAISLGRSILPYKLHGQLWAVNIVEREHSLGGYREMIYHSGCTPKAPKISHLFKTCEKVMAASNWWGTTYHIII